MEKTSFIFMSNGIETIAVKNIEIYIEISMEFGYHRVPTSHISVAEQLRLKVEAVYGVY